MKCHGADGTGNAVRAELPKIPNFTEAAWHMRHKDAQLTVSILDGKGATMPSFSGKVDPQQARALIMHVRAFAPNANKATPKKPSKDAMTPTGQAFEAHLRSLQQELDELRAQFRRLSGSADDREPAKKTPPKQPGAVQPAGPAAADTPAARTLFREHCARCHGKDGTGSAARERLATIPNFTDAAWQARRKDAQLVVSILDGKGQKMPAWRDKLTEAQARGLVAYIRTLAPPKRHSEELNHRDTETQRRQERENQFLISFLSSLCLGVSVVQIAHLSHFAIGQEYEIGGLDGTAAAEVVMMNRWSAPREIYHESLAPVPARRPAQQSDPLPPPG